MPNVAIRFLGFETCKKWMLEREAAKRKEGGERGERVRLASWQTFICGAVPGLSSVILSHPIDVVKSNLMSAAAVQNKENAAQCAKRIFAQQGAAGFFRGVATRRYIEDDCCCFRKKFYAADSCGVTVCG